MFLAFIHCRSSLLWGFGNLKRIRVRPSRFSSWIGMLLGIIFVGIGVIEVIPKAGVFGVLWTFVAATIAIFHAVNLFTENGIASKEIEVDDGALIREFDGIPFDERLRRLEGLRADGLISEDEYRKKRQELIDRSWLG